MHFCLCHSFWFVLFNIWIIWAFTFFLGFMLHKLTLFSPFLRKPSSPKSDDSLAANLIHDKEFYNTDTGSLVLLFSYLPLTVLISHHPNSHWSSLLLQQSWHVFPAVVTAVHFHPTICVLICMQGSSCIGHFCRYRMSLSLLLLVVNILFSSRVCTTYVFWAYCLHLSLTFLHAPRPFCMYIVFVCKDALQRQEQDVVRIQLL